MVLAFSDVVPVDDTGQVLAPSLISRVCAHAPSGDELLSRWWPILPSSVVVKRETLRQCGQFDPGFRSPGYEDPLLWLLARERGEFRYVDRPLVLYRHAPLLQRMEKYVGGVPIFKERVRRHFGAAGAGLIAELEKVLFERSRSRGCGGDGSGRQTRGAPRVPLALRHHPLHARSALRLMRTFLPLAIAGALSSRGRRRRWAAHEWACLGIAQRFRSKLRKAARLVAPQAATSRPTTVEDGARCRMTLWRRRSSLSATLPASARQRAGRLDGLAFFGTEHAAAMDGQLLLRIGQTVLPLQRPVDFLPGPPSGA